MFFVNSKERAKEIFKEYNISLPNNEIITTLDIYNQINYLSILNPDIKKLDTNKVIEISNTSIF